MTSSTCTAWLEVSLPVGRNATPQYPPTARALLQGITVSKKQEVANNGGIDRWFFKTCAQEKFERLWNRKIWSSRLSPDNYHVSVWSKDSGAQRPAQVRPPPGSLVYLQSSIFQIPSNSFLSKYPLASWRLRLCLQCRNQYTVEEATPSPGTW